MFRNKEFKFMFITAAVFTAALSVCGYAICGIAAAVLILILGIVITTGFVIITRRRYADIDNLNSYLVRVLAGDETPVFLIRRRVSSHFLRPISTRQHPLSIIKKIFWPKISWHCQMP